MIMREWKVGVEISRCTPSVRMNYPKPKAPALVASKSRLACPLQLGLAFRKPRLIEAFHLVG